MNRIEAIMIAAYARKAPAPAVCGCRGLASEFLKKKYRFLRESKKVYMVFDEIVHDEQVNQTNSICSRLY